MDPFGYLCDVGLNTTATRASAGLLDLYPSAEETLQCVIFTVSLVPSDEDHC